jgi:metal-responsive CopG/Arc/MetJ family transcriptional regulator
MRTIIEVPAEVIRNLDKVGDQLCKSRAAIIREAIQLYLETRHVPHSDAAFGIWRGKGKEGLTYQEQLRSEWSRD